MTFGDGFAKPPRHATGRNVTDPARREARGLRSWTAAVAATMAAVRVKERTRFGHAPGFSRARKRDRGKWAQAPAEPGEKALLAFGMTD